MIDSSFYSYLAQWGLQSVAMLVTALLLPGLKISGPISAFVTVVVLALINANLWSAALFFQIPNSLSVHVGSLIVANATIFWIVVKLLPGIESSGIVSVLLAPIIFSITSVVITTYEPEINWGRVWSATSRAVSDVKAYVQAPDSVENVERPKTLTKKDVRVGPEKSELLVDYN